MRVEDELEPVGFDAITGFAGDDLDAALAVFRRSAERLLAGAEQQRAARPPIPGLLAASRAALAATDGASFFEQWFAPYRLKNKGFVTAYYEVEIEARLSPSAEFQTPVLARPANLVTLNDSPIRGPNGEMLTSARQRAAGSLEPYPDRRSIEAAATPTASNHDRRHRERSEAIQGPPHGSNDAEEGEVAGFTPLAYVRDAVELFLMQVQGSARLRLPDGSALALTYDGRNGWPYTSIGRLMIERGLVPAAEMSLEALKAKLRALGLEPGEAGRKLMQENRSYVFFRIDASQDRRLGPIGGAGLPLTPLRSIAVDRSLWCYGLPFWISARLPWRSEAEEEFSRLMIAQDTGSAILGVARADLFFGAGPRAGHLAGMVRHAADFFVLPPKDAAS